MSRRLQSATKKKAADPASSAASKKQRVFNGVVLFFASRSDLAFFSILRESALFAKD